MISGNFFKNSKKKKKELYDKRAKTFQNCLPYICLNRVYSCTFNPLQIPTKSRRIFPAWFIKKKKQTIISNWRFHNLFFKEKSNIKERAGCLDIKVKKEFFILNIKHPTSLSNFKLN